MYFLIFLLQFNCFFTAPHKEAHRNLAESLRNTSALFSAKSLQTRKYPRAKCVALTAWSLGDPCQILSGTETKSRYVQMSDLFIILTQVTIWTEFCQVTWMYSVQTSQVYQAVHYVCTENYTDALLVQAFITWYVLNPSNWYGWDETFQMHDVYLSYQ